MNTEIENRLYKRKNEKFYTAKYDRIFKSIFVQEKDHHLMEALLSECLESKVKIIKYLYPELQVSNIDDKEKKVDVLIELDGKKVLIELNTEGKGIRLRNFNYFTSFYSTRIKRGSDYLDDTEHILIDLSYNINSDSYKSVYCIQNENKEQYVKNFKIIEFNMDKITHECYDKIKKGIDSKYKYLCMLNLDEDKLAIISKKDEVVEEYMEELEKLNNDEGFRYVVSAEEDARLTQKLLHDYAIREGHEEGRAKGLAEGRIEGLAEGRIEGLAEGRKEGRTEMSKEIAKKMIDKKYDINVIMDITGLSKEEIDNIK